jgi:hypothetical protein
MRQLGVLLLSLAGTSPAFAQTDPPIPESVKGIKLVIPEAKGESKWGRAQLTKALRRAMTEAVGPLIPSRDFEKAQKKLKLKGAKAFEPENLAKIAKSTNAEFVLAVTIIKKGWLFTARAVLVRVANGAVEMDFRAQYFKPPEEAIDRGKRIGRRTIEKLAQLAGDQGSEPVAVAPPPPPADEPPPPPPPEGEKVIDEKIDDGKVNDPDEPSDPPPPPAIVEAPPPPPPPTAVARPVETVETETGPTENKEEIIRAIIGGGSGLLRTYEISSAAVELSRLSHNLKPLSLVNVDVEITIPSIPIAILLGGAFRPVRYNLSESDPRGALIDAHVDVGYDIAIAGEGLYAYEIMPRVGSRFGVYTVQENPGNKVVSARDIAVTGGVAARLPINEILEINLAVDGGLIVSYSESPATTGDGGLGFLVGGDLTARIWLTPIIAIAFDNRFTFENVNLSGTPTRQLPEDEAQLQDAKISTKDLRTSLGVAFRF